MTRGALIAVLAAGCSSAVDFVPPGPLELLSNVDDDDRDGVRDGLDGVINGADDLREFSRVSLRSRCTGQLTLSLTPPTVDSNVHVFHDGRLLLGEGARQAQVPCGEVTLLIEAGRTRSGAWNGRASLVARHAAASARLELEVAPVVFPDVTHRPRRIFAVDVGEPGARENTGVIAALRATGLSLVLAPGVAHHFERWMQDAISSGAQVADGRRLELVIEMDRPTGADGLEPFARGQLGPDVGLARVGRDVPSLLSGGGNVEVIPPHTGFPHGRLVIGHDPSRPMGRSTRAWLDAQARQGPALVLDTSRLETGHVDELVAFVPSDTPPGWRALVPSPALALERLRALAASGAGARRLRTPTGVTQVSALLADDALRRWNESLVAPLDATANELERATGQPVTRLPQLFEPTTEGRSRAFTPAVTNLVSLDRRVLTASTDLEGDVFESLVRENLEALGLVVQILDASAYHSLGGGLHCGVEIAREPD